MARTTALSRGASRAEGATRHDLASIIIDFVYADSTRGQEVHLVETLGVGGRIRASPLGDERGTAYGLGHSPDRLRSPLATLDRTLSKLDALECRPCTKRHRPRHSVTALLDLWHNLLAPLLR